MMRSLSPISPPSAEIPRNNDAATTPNCASPAHCDSCLWWPPANSSCGPLIQRTWTFFPLFQPYHWLLDAVHQLWFKAFILSYGTRIARGAALACGGERAVGWEIEALGIRGHVTRSARPSGLGG